MAAKLKDGFFVGDADSSQDPEFLELNKISNLINFSGNEVPNVWSSHGLVYLTYNWDDRPDYDLFGLSVLQTKNDNISIPIIITDIIEFIDISIMHGVSVLLFSKKGNGRCLAAATAYFMAKYHWGLEKTFDYIYSKKPEMNINKGFIQQLYALDKRLSLMRLNHLKHHGIDMSDQSIKAIEDHRSNDWDPIYLKYSFPEQNLYSNSQFEDNITDKKSDEILLINSYTNSRLNNSGINMTLTNLSTETKRFKIKFNNTLLEEDINMFPTSPLRATYKPPKGILKHNNKFKSEAKDVSSNVSDSKIQDNELNNSFTSELSDDPVSPLSNQYKSYKNESSSLYDYVGIHSNNHKSEPKVSPFKEKGYIDDKKIVSNEAFHNDNYKSNKSLSSGNTHIKTPSLYDLANMSIYPSSTSELDDPLAAFGILSSSAVKVRHDILHVDTSEISKQASKVGTNLYRQGTPKLTMKISNNNKKSNSTNGSQSSLNSVTSNNSNNSRVKANSPRISNTRKASYDSNSINSNASKHSNRPSSPLVARPVSASNKIWK